MAVLQRSAAVPFTRSVFPIYTLRNTTHIAIIPRPYKYVPFFFLYYLSPSAHSLDLGENGTRSHIGNVNHLHHLHMK